LGANGKLYLLITIGYGDYQGMIGEGSGDMFQNDILRNNLIPPMILSAGRTIRPKMADIIREIIASLSLASVSDHLEW